MRKSRVKSAKAWSSKKRFDAIKKVIEEKLPITEVCQEFGISRKTFYKWKRRYDCASEGLKLEALNDKQQSFPRQTPQEIVDHVIDLVLNNPSYSSRTISNLLPKKSDGKPLLSEYGVRKVLKRLNLSHIEDRKRYAEKFPPAPRVAPVPRFIPLPRWITELPALSHLPPPVLGLIGRVRQIGWLFSPTSALLSLSSLFFATGTIFLTRALLASQNTSVGKIGILFSEVSLIAGFFFFLYSIKYYFTLAMVLAYSRQKGIDSNQAIKLSSYQDNNHHNGNGLDLDIDHPNLEELSDPTNQPFISIHVPLYNEKRVVERVIRACAQQDYDRFEVLVLDDSTDETTEIAERVAREINGELKVKSEKCKVGNAEYRIQNTEELEDYPRVRVLHRPTRAGFKGGALKYALERVHPETEYVMVFDADFVPFPDTIKQFLRYFKLTTGRVGGHLSTRPARSRSPLRSERLEEGSNIAAITGYQWHVLNKNENWITRGVRTEYSGSYIIERSGRELLSLLKIIHGSVYMIRRDVLEEEGVGWGTSITEDFELTLKLYSKGYKVVFTPYIQAPSECVSTLKRLIRQRMRWSEGHSHCIRRMFRKLLFGDWKRVSNLRDLGSLSHLKEGKGEGRSWVSSPLTLREKLEFLYLSPYYLQSALFMVGNLAWFLAEAIFHVHLPYWTELWGWSLVFSNMFSLPLINGVGLFIEEADSRDYLGLLSFIALCYLLVPFQAYASIKGFLAQEEGTWFRTPKTGHITIDVVKGTFSRLLGLFGGGGESVPQPAIATLSPSDNLSSLSVLGNLTANRRFALATAGNHFNLFEIKPRRRIRRTPKIALAALLAVTVSLYSLSREIPFAYASNWTNLYLHTTSNHCGSDEDMDTTPGSDPSSPHEISSTSTTPWYWYSPTLPTGSGNASITAGTWTVHVHGTFYSGGGGSSISFNSNLDLVDAGTCNTGVIALGTTTTKINAQGDFPAGVSVTVTDQTITAGTPKRVRLTLVYSSDSKGAYMDVNYDGAADDSHVVPSTLTIPEKLVFLVAAAPFIPTIAMWFKRRKAACSVFP